MPGAVAPASQQRGGSHLRPRQFPDVGHVHQLAAGWLDATSEVDPVGQADTGWIAACQQTPAGRRADRAAGVGVGEDEASFRQPIQVGGCIEGAAKGGQIHGPQVVDQDEEDVGRLSVHTAHSAKWSPCQGHGAEV